MSKSFFKECPFVKELKPSNFDPIKTFKIKIKGNVFVMFYSKSCGHCIQTKPEFCKASQSIGFVQLCAMNCEKFSEHIRKMNEDYTREKGKELIEGFPTLIFYKDGEIKSIYDGERKAKDMIEFCMEQVKN